MSKDYICTIHTSFKDDEWIKAPIAKQYYEDTTEELCVFDCFICGHRWGAEPTDESKSPRESHILGDPCPHCGWGVDAFNQDIELLCGAAGRETLRILTQKGVLEERIERDLNKYAMTLSKLWEALDVIDKPSDRIFLACERLAKANALFMRQRMALLKHLFDKEGGQLL